MYIPNNWMNHPIPYIGHKGCVYAHYRATSLRKEGFGRLDHHLDVYFYTFEYGQKLIHAVVFMTGGRTIMMDRHPPEWETGDPGKKPRMEVRGMGFMSPDGRSHALRKTVGVQILEPEVCPLQLHGQFLRVVEPDVSGGNVDNDPLHLGNGHL